MKSSNKYVLSRIKPEIEKIIKKQGLELFDIVLRSEKGERVLRISVDNEKGAGIDDCSKASKAISDFLDSDENLVPFTNYSLEVSTPGLERPLRSENDYVRFAGNKCKIITIEKDSTGRVSYTGKIDSVKNGVVSLNVEKENKTFQIAISNISKANLMVEFEG